MMMNFMNTSRCLMLFRALLAIAVLSTWPSRAAGQQSCTQSQSAYKTGTYVATTYQSYYERYCCGWRVWGGCWKYCTRTKYRRITYTATRSVLYYYRVCCSGYGGSGCLPLCSPTCRNGGVCVLPDTCSCVGGWTGSLCSEDIDECELGVSGCEQGCTNTVGSYSCTCGDRYKLDDNQHNCNDLNECLTGDHNCTSSGSSPVAMCVNLLEGRGFECSCDHLIGYELNQTDYTSCQDINECASENGQCEHQCENTEGSYTCTCNAGFTEDGLACRDTDECTTGTHNCSSDGDAPAECFNTFGSFTCTCTDSGYTLNATYNTCDDVNECKEGTAGCNQICMNTVGSYECSCYRGYRLANGSQTFCTDVDECLEGSHGCEMMCENTIGSYQCKCPLGHGLRPDNHTCEGLECPIVSSPENGTVSCPQPATTGTVCTYTCDDGFDLVGRAIRVCLPSSKWTGSTPYCQPKLCDEFEPPDNGFILLPCTREYGTSCRVGCELGFAISGTASRMCTIDSRSELKWTDSPECKPSDVCDERPCRHGGRCASSGASFTCDCEGTGYTGQNCEIGIVSISPIPTLAMGEKFTARMSAKPDAAVYVYVSLSQTLLKRVRLTVRDGTGSFTVVSEKSGFHSLTYRLSGRSSRDFQDIPETSFFVREHQDVGSSNKYFEVLNSSIGHLVEGCCENMDPGHQSIGMCGTKMIELRSSCRWDSHETPGVVFVRSGSFSLPVSVSGVIVQDGAITLPSQIHDCLSCVEARNATQPSPHCYHYEFTGSDIQNFLSVRALAVTYLNAIQPLLPKWVSNLTIDMELVNPDISLFAPYDFHTDLLEPQAVLSLKGCENLELSNQGDSTFSVLRYGRTITATVDGEMLSYPDPTIVDTPMCFAVHLCQGASSPLHIGLSPETENMIVSQFLKEYIDSGWMISIRSMGLSKEGRELQHDITAEYWNGLTLAPLSPPEVVDLLMNADIETSHESGVLAVQYKLTGSALCHYQSRKGIATGTTSTTVSTTIEGTRKTVVLAGNSDTSTYVDFTEELKPTPFQLYVSVIDYQTTYRFCICTPDVSIVASNQVDCSQRNTFTTGISSKLSYRQYPDQAFFQLLSLSEETVECPFDVFVSMSNAREITGLSLHTNCPNINLGLLTFRNMEHQFYFSGTGSFEQFCLPNLRTSDVPNPALYIKSSLPRSTTLPLGNFLELRNEAELSVIYDRDRPGFVAQVDFVQVSIFETSFVTDIAISDDSFLFSTTVNVFNAYSANLEVSAPTDVAPWNRLPLTIHGVMNAGPNSFIDSLETRIHRELQRRASTAESRKNVAEMGRQRVLQQAMTLEKQFNDSKETVVQANQMYANANATLIDALAELDAAQQAFDNSTKELSQLRNSLNNLCMEMECKEECMSGCRPGVCYEETYTTATGQCPYIDHVRRRVRVEPFYTSRRVWRWITVCRNPYYWFFQCFLGCRRQTSLSCYGKCASVIEREPLFNYETQVFAVQRSRECDVSVFSGTRPYACCETVECAIKAPNKTCLDANIQCQVARRTTLQQIELTEQASVAPFLQLDQARTRVATARSAVSGAELRLELASQRLRQIEPAYISAKLAINIAEDSYRMTLNEIGSDLRLSQLLSEYSGSKMLRISNISFDLIIVTQSPTVIPLNITYETPYNGGTYHKQVEFDFMEGSRELAFGEISTQLIQQAFPDMAHVARRSARSEYRVARQAEEAEMNMNQLRFDENCAALNNVWAFLSEIADSLFEINSRIQSARDDINSQGNITLDVSDDFSLLNFTVLEAELNVTINLESLKESLADNEELRAYATLLNDYQNANTELLAATEATSFMDWLTQVQVIYDENSTVGGYPCLSFGDCLLVATNVLEDVLLDTPRSNALLLIERLPSARDELLNLVIATNLTITFAIESISPIFSLAEQATQIEYWCTSLPVISVQPPAEVDVPSQGTLNITCEAESNLPVSYQWKRNGNTIPNANSSNLIIKNMQRLDSANYTCQASNDIGTVNSIDVSVVVYELPEFYLTPVSTSAYEGAEGGAWFTCNSTAWPYPGWRWFYRPTPDGQWSLIDGEDTNELHIPQPQKEAEGWYACETFTRHGILRSDPVYLRVLPVTVSQQLIPMEFQLVGGGNTSCTLSELLTLTENELQQFVDSNMVSLQDLAIHEDVDSEYTATMSLVTHNVTGDDIHSTPFVEIANRALPTRDGLQRNIRAIENFVDSENFTLDCGETIFSADTGSLTLQRLTYVCPEGQQLRNDYLLCVSCEPGSFSSYREQTRVFGTEALTERLPVCQQCPRGSFESQVGSRMCTPCPKYHTTKSPGAVSADECSADPLKLDCSSVSAGESVTVDCATNRPTAKVLCSFDERPLHLCELPVTVNTQVFSAGSHSVKILATDSIGFTARTIINYSLPEVQTEQDPTVPDLGFVFTNDSPRIAGNSVSGDFELTRPAERVTCELLHTEHKVDCSSGSFLFGDLEPGTYRLRVAAENHKEDRIIVRWRIVISSDPSFCIVHFINGGVSVEEGMAMVEFAVVGPAEGFTCTLDRGEAFPCTSPVEVSGLESGEHHFRVSPVGCGRDVLLLSFKFTV